MTVRLSLREIFDTKLTRRCDKWEPYFDVYETYFSKYRDQSPTFVEVGVQYGGSMEMWREYFNNANIYGIDHSPEINQLNIPGVNLIQGDQSSIEFWKDFLADKGDIDCFLDDGGHTMMQQIITLTQVWPKIKPGGVYICEDTHTSYWEEFGGKFQDPNSFIGFVKNIIDLINIEHIPNINPPKQIVDKFGDVGSIHFYNSMVVLIKNKPLFNRVIVNDDKKTWT